MDPDPEVVVPVVIGPTGDEQTLGEFLRQCKDSTGLSVAKIVSAAGLSRANYYLLEGGQRPSLGTLVALLGAMGLEAHLPTAEDESRTADLIVQVRSEAYVVDLRWSAEEREKSRDRYVTATASGVGAAANRLGDARIPALVAAGLLARLAPGIAPKVVGEVMLLVATHMREQRAADQKAAQPAPTRSGLLNELKTTATSMTTEELETLLATMKAMREARADNPPA